MTNLWRLLRLIKPQLGWMALGGLLSLITMLASISLLAVSGWFLSMMAMAGIAGVAANYFTPGAVVRFLAIVRTVGRYAERMVTHQATFKILSGLRYYFYQQLEPLIPYYKINFQSGDLLARVQQDIESLDNFYLRILLPCFVAFFSVPLVCLGVSYISETLALVLAIALITLGFGLPWLSYQFGKGPAKQKSRLAGDLKLELVDGVAAMRELLVYQVGQRYLKTVANVSDAYHEVEVKLHRLTAFSNALSMLVVNGLVFASLFILIPIVQAGELDGEFIASMALLMLVSVETVMSLPLAFQLLPHTMASANRLFEIIDKPVPERKGEQAVSPGPIHFSDLNFAYPEQQKQALRGINLTLQPGEKVALIGPSGAGKSTLVNLLMGFWPTPDGAISVNGVDINRLDPESLRQHISLMSQSGHLFHATIGDNLRLANPEVTSERMREVCEAAGLMSFIDSLEDGFDTWLGETGAGLSGGQKQRLQIAQMLLRQARVVVLDEPTKGLDSLTERKVMASLFAHIEDAKQTLVMITHKPVMLQKMDKIILMDEGRIIAAGNHAQLFDNNEYYRELLDYF